MNDSEKYYANLQRQIANEAKITPLRQRSAKFKAFIDRLYRESGGAPIPERAERRSRFFCIPGGIGAGTRGVRKPE